MCVTRACQVWNMNFVVNKEENDKNVSDEEQLIGNISGSFEDISFPPLSAETRIQEQPKDVAGPTPQAGDKRQGFGVGCGIITTGV